MKYFVLIALLSFHMEQPCFAQAAIHHEFISHPDSPEKKVEYYWNAPKGKGPWPLLVYLHGHQEGTRPGGKDYVDWGVLKGNAELGYVSVAISQPGYGASDGPPDFCGPFTQHAVTAVIDEFKKKKFIDPKKIGLQGISRGAIIAAMIAVSDPSLAGAVLISGFYDLQSSMEKLKSSESPHLKGMLKNIEAEIGKDADRYSVRSALSHAGKIKTPLLILNGEDDDRTDPQQALALAAELSKRGVYSKAVIYPKTGHAIPLDARSKEVIPFTRQYIKGKRETP